MTKEDGYLICEGCSIEISKDFGACPVCGLPSDSSSIANPDISPVNPVNSISPGDIAEENRKFFGSDKDYVPKISTFTVNPSAEELMTAVKRSNKIFT